MVDLLNFFGTQTINVADPIQTAYGPKAGEARTISNVMVQEKTVLVRDTTGQQVASTAQAALPLGENISIGAIVTLPTGRVTRVISIERADTGPAFLPRFQQLNLE